MSGILEKDASGVLSIPDHQKTKKENDFESGNEKNNIL